jgi:hypothetical protein
MFLHNVAVSHAKNITFTFTFTFTWRNRSCPAAGPAVELLQRAELVSRTPGTLYGCAPLYFVSSFRLEAASRPLPSTL